VKLISPTRLPVSSTLVKAEDMELTTTNPLFRNISLLESTGHLGAGAKPITLSGVIHKASILLACCAVSAVWSWMTIGSLLHKTAKGALLVFSVCAVGAWVLAYLTVRNRAWAPFTAPIYAVLQGLVLGAISAGFDKRYPGIAIQAVGLTIAICFCLLVAYRYGFIRLTEGFNRKLTAVTGGVVLFYVANFALALMGIQTLSVLNIGIPGILVTAIIVVIAGLNFLSDFDFAAQCAAGGLPKYMEWYTALGLIVTLVWLYLEMLRLVSKIRKAREDA